MQSVKTCLISAHHIKKLFSSNKIQISPKSVKLVQDILEEELNLVIDRCKSNKIKRLSPAKIIYAKKWYNR